ncbi:PadR family transcriptional regulator [Micromonospora sp. CPCC 205371]|nr:PadR family transcriptional regulator [Micromonospora sp. CPCC 205371]
MRMTLQVQLTLRAMLERPDSQMYGLELVEATGLPPGTMYPIMARLENAGWVSSRWEEIGPEAKNRPRRRYYRLTADGIVQARSALASSDARRQARARGPIGDILPGALG